MSTVRIRSPAPRKSLVFPVNSRLFRYLCHLLPTFVEVVEPHQDSGVADGQEVEVLITVVPAGEKLGSGFLRTEGALADDDQWDAIMDEIHQARRNDPRAVMPELE